jgi:type IV fimbrial biogenesis protein FimT
MSENTRLATPMAAGSNGPEVPSRLQAGFTIIELMIVMVIMAVLATLVAPSFLGLIASSNVSRAVNGFVSDSRFARGEGMRRGKSVTICRTSTPSAASPACSAGDGVGVGGWREGWVVFVDENGDGSFDAGDTVLRVQDEVSGISDFVAVAADTTSAVATGNKIVYDGTGRAVGQQGRWLVHPAGGLSGEVSYARTLCMNSVGRVRVTKGEAAC